MFRRAIAWMLAPLALTAAAGCASAGDRGPAAAAVATRFVSAVANQDGAAACTLLAPETAAEIEGSAGAPCARAVLGAKLPLADTVTGTSVYGQWAQVRLSDDTMFLAVFPGGWRVVAAGCTSRPQRPYDCLLQGS